MAVAAPILPPAPNELDVPVEVREELRTAWAAWWEPLRADLRNVPPVPDTPEEQLLLARFFRGLIALTERFGGALRPLLRAGFSRAFEDLVRAEEQQAVAMRRLGVKLLERAVEVLGEFYEVAIVFAPPNLAPGLIAQLLPEDDTALAATLDPTLTALMRLELSVFVAFDLVRDESLEEFADWARRAHVAARRAAPFVAALAAPVRAVGPDLSADLVVSHSAFERVVDLIESPPAPSLALRSLLGRGAP